MARRNSFHYGLFFKKSMSGVFLLLVFGVLAYLLGGGSPAEALAFWETVPLYEKGTADKAADTSGGAVDTAEGEEEGGKEEAKEEEAKKDMDGIVLTELVHSDEIIYQPETDIEVNTAEKKASEYLTADDLEKMKDLDYLKRNFYIVDKRTALSEDLFQAEAFMQENLAIDNSIPGPKVLIFHTHASEMFADSAPGDLMEGIAGAGEKLANLLTDKYGIETMHHMGRYDVVDGKSQILGAYERMEPDIRKILVENPSIQVVIDMHRDGVNEGTRLVKTIDGKPCAQIMFFNGICRLNKNGALEPIGGLENPYVKQNLALSFQMQLAANASYPELTRKIYVNAYRYSLHMLPRSMLIEVGAQTNTKEEISNSMDYLAELLAGVLLEN